MRRNGGVLDVPVDPVVHRHARIAQQISLEPCRATERVISERNYASDNTGFSRDFTPRDNGSHKEKGRPVSRTAFPVSR
jgi:hypothetical protein